MPTKQGSVALLTDPVAQQLLESTNVARLAYVWTDGTPRVVPTWFHWTGQEIVLGSPADAPKLVALRRNPKVALTIDTQEWPYKVLLVRGTARLQEMNDVVPEYAQAAERYFGADGGKGWVENLRKMSGGRPRMGRVAITPEWVAVHDFEQRWPSAIEKAMEAAQAG
jgi:PPOX class probable F420-dependent enzyme